MRGIVAALWLLAACGEQRQAPAEGEPAREAPAPAPAWPAEGAPLTTLEVQIPEGFETRQVYVDAGHGLTGNPGAVGAYCQQEQDFNLQAAQNLAERLRRTGAFEVRVSREDNQGPGYNERLREANAWADVLISLHFDARLAAEADTWSPEEGQTCRFNEGEHGFSVLYSDEGSEPLPAQRRALARNLAARLVQAGFPPYLGRDYEGKYELDPDQPGAWVDRHAPNQRILMLRGPRVPSVIVETHQALDRQEVLRWREDRTHDAFGAAVAQGLVDFFASAPPGT